MTNAKLYVIICLHLMKGGEKMLLVKTAKVQETKTNVVVNIPREQREALGINGGDTVLISADTKNKFITIKKIGGE